MALSSVAKEISLFQILDVPYATAYHTLDGMGVIVSSTTITADAYAAAKTAILNYVNTLDAATLAVLETLLTDWDSVGNNSIKIENGGLSSIQGVFFNYDEKRGRIEAKVKGIVPFYRVHEILLRQAEVNTGSMVGVSR